MLILHISSVIMTLLAGALALFFPGPSSHKAFNKVFIITLFFIFAYAAYLVYEAQSISAAPVSILVFYLAATAAAASLRKDAKTGLFEISALLVALAVTAGMLISGLEATIYTQYLNNELSAETYYFFAMIAAAAAIEDIVLILRGNCSRTFRSAQYLWRMCFALFLAASFFLGQQQIFPEFIRESNLLFAPVIIIIVLMLYWLIRVRFTNWFNKNTMPGA